MKKILWVEEEADSSMIGYITLFESINGFDLTIAKNATEAMHHLHSKKQFFDLVIMDIRIPPGLDGYWEEEYLKGDNSLPKERLGIAVINKYFTELIRENEKQKWIIFTIEPFWTVSEFFKKYSLNWFIEGVNYFQKTKYRFPEEFLKDIEDKLT
ncbi:MAG: hypothetical protein IT215_04300 [Chitinophagaceae bacterium]|nr:hypothetical protein [Chitinophagaceae bacterium]